MRKWASDLMSSAITRHLRVPSALAMAIAALWQSEGGSSPTANAAAAGPPPAVRVSSSESWIDSRLMSSASPTFTQ